jgi:hypothetical protein
MARGLIGNSDFNVALGVTLVKFFDTIGLGFRPTLYRNLPQIVFLGETGVEGKENLVPRNDVAGRFGLIPQVGAFNETKVPDIMDRMIAPAGCELRLIRMRQGRLLQKDRIKDYLLTVFTLTPDSEMTGKLLLQDVTTLLIGRDGQTNGRGRRGVRGSANALAKALPE